MNNNEQYSLSSNLIGQSDAISTFSIKDKKLTIAQYIRAKLDIDTAAFLGLIAGVLLHLLILFAALMAPVGAHAEVGDLRSFGTGGRTQFNVGSSGLAPIAGVVQYRNGSMIVATTCNEQIALDWCFTRLNFYGAVDTTWGTANSGTVIETTSEQDILRGVVAAENSGWFAFGNCASSACIIKYLSSGARDTSFGLNGKKTVSGYSVNAVQPRADGRITYVSACYEGGVELGCLGRLLANGTFDASFNAGAERKVVAGPTTLGHSYGFVSIALDPVNEKIWLTGSCLYDNSNFAFCVARVKPDGTMDTTFTGTGYAKIPIMNVSDRSQQILLRPDGSTIIVGECRTSTIEIQQTGICVAQLRPFSATLDTQFGTNGFRILNIGNSPVNRFGRQGAFLQQDGSISIFGECHNSAGVSRACMALLAANGSDDLRLSSARAVQHLGTNASQTTQGVGVSALVREHPGTHYVHVFGNCVPLDNSTASPCLSRIEWAEPRGGACSMDIDGDGKVLPTTDGVILARIAAGMRGQSVLTGVTGFGAIRFSWEQMHAYLTRECGMKISP
jgi:uncharacterized delta-60 repeat protein